MAAVLLLLASALLGNIWYTQGLLVPFTKAPDNPTFVALGETAKLEWNFPIDDSFKRVEFYFEKSPGNFEYLIYKTKDGTVTTHPSAPSNLTSRVSIEDTATLVIKDVRAEEAIRYQCTYVYSTGVKSRETAVELKLSESPDNVTFVPKIQSINPREEAVFNCTADGVPTPEIEWYNGYGEKIDSKAGVEINGNSGSSALTFRNVQSTDSGTYICKIKNIAGERNATGTLIVPSCEVRGEQNQTSPYCVEVGDIVQLVCPIYGFPQPEVVWDYPNKSNKTFRSKNTLSVKVTSDGDFGKYGCSGCGKTFTSELKNCCSLPSSTVPPAVPQKATTVITVLAILGFFLA